MDFDKVADKVFQAIQQRIEKAIGPFQGRLDALHEQIKALPLPKDGKDGRNGVDGKDAPAPDMEVLVREVHKLIPVPADGKDGRVGIDGKDGAKGIDGKDGRDGIDGKSVTSEDVRAMLDEIYTQKQAAYALDFEKRAQERLDRFMERIPAPKDGKDGKDGIDAFPLESVKTELRDGGRILVLKFDDGKRSMEHEHITEFPVNRGVFKDGSSYLRGDEVTFGGSVWAALESTESKPGIDKTWVLRTKRGRDGKDSVKIPRDPNEPVKIR